MMKILLQVLIFFFISSSTYQCKSRDKENKNILSTIVDSSSNFPKKTNDLLVKKESVEAEISRIKSKNFVFTVNAGTELNIKAFDSLNNQITILNVSDPNYKSLTYGENRFEILRDFGNKLMIMFYARYGGDGEHTREIAKFINFESGKLKLLGQLPIYQPIIQNFEEDNLVSISGYYILMFCDVCDGWEVSDDNDIFKIPINVEIRDSIKYYAIIHGEEKKEVIRQFEQQKVTRDNMHLSRQDTLYLKYSEGLSDEFYDLINR